MRNTLAGILLTWMVAAAPCAHAQQEGSPEDQISIKPGEAAHLDRDSIGSYGSTKRFEVEITWSQDAGPRPPSHKARRARYVADCKAGTLTVAAVAVFDRAGMLEKRMLVPPGAVEPMTPEPGSPPGKWLQEVCAN
jgi:hypothetical protein